MYIENFINKIKLPFRKDKELYRRLYAILGFYPKNIAYYKQALLHKSLSVKGKDGRSENNERLEFLGDAILDAIVGDIVFRHFQGKNEGFLTNTRSKLVQREMLGKLAVEMGIDKLIRYNGQAQTPHSYMAGNAFEALVGAIYLDYGYMRCMDFMKQRILSRIVNIDKVAYKEVNFKSKLLEWSQKNRIRITFEDNEQRKSNGNSSTFYSEVVIEGISSGTGKGFSKKEAQQNAAKDALYKLKKQKGFEQSIFDAKGKRTAMEEQPQALLPEIPEELLKPQKEEQTKKRPEKPAKQEKPARPENSEKPAKQEKTARPDNSDKQEKQANQPNQKPDALPKQEKQGKTDRNAKPKPKTTEKKAEKVKGKVEKAIEKVEILSEKKAEKKAEEQAVDSTAPNTEQTEVKRKPRRRHSHAPKVSTKTNTEYPSSENV